MAIQSLGRQTFRNVALLGLFLASGCSALIYEIVWFQQLSLVLGASAVSLAILLASFMGGICLGSLVFSRWVSLRHHPLRVYALLEMLIAVCGLGTLWLFPVVGRIYWSLSLVGSNDLVARSFLAMVLMLPPTAMMGAALPVVARWTQSTRSGMAWLGWFYGANTFGAVIGCLVAGMYLLRIHDVYVATYVAAAINAGVAISAVLLAWQGDSFPFSAPARRDLSIFSFQYGQTEPVACDFGDTRESSRHSPSAVRSESSSNSGYGTWNVPTTFFGTSDARALSDRHHFIVVHVVMGLSGMTALGAEVIWTRHLGLLLGPTVYTFSIILAVFLLGLGLGSGVGTWIGRRTRSPGLALAITQLLLLLAIPYAAYLIVNVVPYWLTLRGSDELFTVRVTRDVVRTLVTLLPATCLWGASFPLAVATLTGYGRDAGRLVGGLYAANTFGAIVGSLGVSLIAIPSGGQFVQQLLISVCGLSGMQMLWAVDWQIKRSMVVVFSRRTRRLRSGLGWLALAIAGVVCLFAWNAVPVTPNRLLADGRCLGRWSDSSSYLYVAEGLDSPIVVSDLEDGTRCFHVAGKIEASTRERDLRTQRLLGHLPALAHPSPQKVLVVGCGSGMTAGSFLLHPSVDEIVICELEKCVINAARDHFEAYNYGILRDLRTRIVCDDARHFLATTRESFDIITVDPIHPWVKGAAALYTVEFFRLCKSHLNRNGIVTLWVPLYESNEATVKCEMATFLQQFPQATIWSGQNLQVGYDLVLIGSGDGGPIDIPEMMTKMSSSPSLQFSFAEMGLPNVDSLSNRFTANGHELKAWLKGAEINRDGNLRLQYLAGTNPDYTLEQQIFQSIVSARDGVLENSIPTVTVISPDER